MNLFDNILLGFGVGLSPLNLMVCFLGVLTGTLIGVLPGLGPTAAISLLLPMTFGMDPVAGIIMLAGIYYGAMYGGSTTSVLINIPGEAASVITCLDGHRMAMAGRAGPALGMCAFGSFIGGTASIIGLMILAPWLSEAVLRFGPPEYLALMLLGLTLVTFLSSGPMSKSLLMAAFGLFLGCTGMDSVTGTPRYTFGLSVLLDGVGLVPVIMGFYGVGEVLANLEQPMKREIIRASLKIRDLLPNALDWRNSAGAIARGSVVGFLLGVLPGGGVILASFASYAIEKRFSKHPEKFGTGIIEGVAGPETANNAAAGGSFVPLLSLGIPAGPVMAIFMGSLILHGIQPGPMMISSHPELFWGVVTSMYIGNVMLLILNVPLLGIWVRFLRVPYSILFPLVLFFCLIGSYTLNNNVADVYVMVLFGMIGYLCRKYQYDTPPLVLAMVLGPLIEANLRRSLILSDGDLLIIVKRPISLFFVSVALLLLLLPLIKKRQFVGSSQEG